MLSIPSRNKSDVLEDIVTDQPVVDDPKDKFIFFGIVALFGTAILGVINTLAIGWLAIKPPPTLVRDPIETTAYRVRAADAERTAAEVKRFVVDRMYKLHTWTGTIPSQEQPGLLTQDPGILITGKNVRGQKITTPAFEASFSLTESIRKPIVEKISKQTPQEIFANDPQQMARGTYVLLMPRKWLGPERLKDGRWKMTLISDINAFSPAYPQGRAISKFNKDIYIAETPEVPLLYEDVAYQQLAYYNRYEGFEIDAIVNTTREDIRAPR